MSQAINTKILVVEDQKAMAMLLKTTIETRFNVEVLVAHSLAQAQAALEAHEGQIEIALTDLNLPDAPNGESVTLLRQSGITTVVLTASYDEKLRVRMYQEHVADFVLKEGAAAIEYVIRLLTLLLTNSQREIWVVNVSDRMARKLSGLLSVHRFRVRIFEQKTTLEKELAYLTPSLLIIGDASQQTDWLYNLSTLRARFEFYALPIVACIENGGTQAAVKYMKYGATDYIAEPFSAEEFYARINQNIEQQRTYQEIKTISETDALSGLYNRGYCFDQGEAQFNRWNQDGKHAFAMLVDIDFFKQINDQFGHPEGDKAIRFIADRLKVYFDDFIVARFGGEEFIVVGAVENKYPVLAQAEKLRVAIEAESIVNLRAGFTISAGIAFSANRFDQLISLADQMLYEAKKQGRNRVCHID